jgi:lysophospholipase L1-like esterase
MLSGDGIHPNQKGYDWMGDTWYSSISSYLP